MITLPSLTIKVIAMYRSELDLDAQVRDGNIELFGDVIYTDEVPLAYKPEEVDRVISFEITNTDTAKTECYTVSFDADGSFDYSYSIATEGNYSITAYFCGTEVIAKSCSVTLAVDTISGSVGSGFGFIPGFEFIIALAVLTTVTIYLKIDKRKM